MIDILKICHNITLRLCNMNFEDNKGNEIKSSEQLIFPIKREKDDKIVNRISEQELRLLFIEELKKNYPKLYYSIETPTEKKYRFGKSLNDICESNLGQSALIDLCILEAKNKKFHRICNIEFKFNNVEISHIAKDIFKLITEKANGAYIQLLKNTNSATLLNKKKSGIINKIYNSFVKFKDYINSNKEIEIIIISLQDFKKSPFIYHFSFKNGDFEAMLNLQNWTKYNLS